MAGYCPVPGPEDPLVRSLLGVVDCNVQLLVRNGYGALFQPSSPFTVVLTALMTLYVAFLGFGLLLGRVQLRVGELVLTAVKLAAVLTLATQWETYQTLVFRFLFEGPATLAGVMLDSSGAGAAIHRGDVFDGLQQTFDQLNAAAEVYYKHAPTAASPLAGGPASGAMLLTVSAGTLLLSSLGVLLAAKVVLGLLLAVGPVFVALLLFDATHGLFEGWLRASLAFAFAPLAVTLLLGVALAMLDPTLAQLAEAQARGEYPLGPVYGVLILSLVFTAVSVGLLVAGGLIASGFKLPARRVARPTSEAVLTHETSAAPAWLQPRAARVAAAAAALEQREGRGRPALGWGRPEPAQVDRRTVEIAGAMQRGASAAPQRATVATNEPRIGQAIRRSAGPRATRIGRRPAR